MLRALVVDDEPGFRLSLAEVLRLEGWSTLTASTCREATLELAKDAVDVLFVDVNLPDGNGLSLLSRKDLPSVVVTGDPSPSLVDEALRRGARDYLAKPVDRLRVRMTLAALARERRLQQEIGRLQAEIATLRSGPLPA